MYQTLKSKLPDIAIFRFRQQTKSQCATIPKASAPLTGIAYFSSAKQSLTQGEPSADHTEKPMQKTFQQFVLYPSNNNNKNQ